MGGQGPTRWRIFVALSLDEATRGTLSEVCSSLAARPEFAPVRWTRPENLHLTLRFLGDTDSKRVPEISRALERELVSIPPLRCSLSGVSWFPRPRRPRVIAAVLAGAEAMQLLSEAVERAVVSCGFPAEPRPFRAHITLGRIKGVLAHGPEIGLAFDELTMWVRGVELFRSRLEPGGPIYSILHSAALGGE